MHVTENYLVTYATLCSERKKNVFADFLSEEHAYSLLSKIIWCW